MGQWKCVEIESNLSLRVVLLDLTSTHVHGLKQLTVQFFLLGTFAEILDRKKSQKVSNKLYLHNI